MSLGINLMAESSCDLHPSRAKKVKHGETETVKGGKFFSSFFRSAPALALLNFPLAPRGSACYDKKGKVISKC
jgi:hypothetical protein